MHWRADLGRLAHVILIGIVLATSWMLPPPHARADLSDTQPWETISATREVMALTGWNGRLAAADREGGLILLDTARSVVQVLNTGDGLTSNELRDLDVDEQGRLWLATARAGILRIDPAFVIRPVVGLVNLSVSSLDADGAFVYYGTQGFGAGRIAAGLAEAVYTAEQDGLVSDDVQAVAAYDGRAWFATDVGVSEFANNVFITRNAGLGSTAVYDVIAGPAGVFIAFDSGVLRYDESGQRWEEPAPGVSRAIRSLAFDGNDVIALSFGDEAFRLGEAAESWQTIALDLSDRELNCVGVLENGEVWYGGRQDHPGRVNLDPVAILQRPENATPIWVRRLFGTDVRDVELDGAGGLWMSYQAPYNGLSHWRADGRVVSYALDEPNSGLGWCADKAKFAFIRARSTGDLWVASNTACVTRVSLDPSDRPDLAEYEQITKDNSGLRLIRIFKIAEDRRGRIWFMGDGQFADEGLGIDVLLDPSRPFDPASWLAVTPSDNGLAGDNIINVTFDGRGVVWICVEGVGVQRWDYDGPTRSDDAIVDPVTVQDPFSWTLLPGNFANYDFAQPRDVALASDGKICIATADQGLFLVDGANLNLAQSIRDQQATLGLLSLKCRSLAFDDRGALWVGTDVGLNRVTGRGSDIEIDAYTSFEAFELFQLGLRRYTSEIISPISGYNHWEVLFDPARRVVYGASQTGVSRVSVGVGVSEPPEGLQFVLSPNPYPPGEDRGLFISGIDGSGSVLVEVFTLTGALILSSEFDAEDLNLDPVWDVKDFNFDDVASGLYLIRVVHNEEVGTAVFAVER